MYGPKDSGLHYRLIGIDNMFHWVHFVDQMFVNCGGFDIKDYYLLFWGIKLFLMPEPSTPSFDLFFPILKELFKHLYCHVKYVILLFFFFQEIEKQV